MRILLLLIGLLTSPFLQAQNIEGTWFINDPQSNKKESPLSTIDKLHLEKDAFYLIAKDSLVAQGVYNWDNEFLSLEQKQPTDTTFQFSSNQFAEDDWQLRSEERRVGKECKTRRAAGNSTE